jgi:hypothetical protein
MDIQTLREIKELASEALNGRQKLERLHAAHGERLKEGMTRARSTTYHATCANLMTDTVTPAEQRIKEIVTKCVAPQKQ